VNRYLSDVAALVEGPYEVDVERIVLRGEGGEPVEAIHPPLGMRPRGWSCIPTSWGSVRCSTT
jgi:hypothetical protein